MTFTNPRQNYDGSGGASAAVPVTYAHVEAEFGTISAAVFYIESSIAATYGLETDHTNNPVQLNSTLVYKISDAATPSGQQYFVGSVVAKPQIRTFEEGRFLEVRCLGYEGALRDALCPDSSGSYVWKLATSDVLVSSVPLQKTAAYGSFAGETLWPDPDDATGAKCYVRDADSQSDTLDTTINSGDTVPFDVILTTNNEGFGPRGWLKIGTEWFYYDGYADTAAGGKYRCNVTARAQLGTSAATHSAGATVYNKLGKELAPGICELRRDGVQLRRDKEFRPHPQLGCFVLGGEAGADPYTATARYYDSDAQLDAGSTVVTLNTVVTQLATGSGDYGGAKFSGGQLSLDSPGIGITRYDYNPDEKSPYAWQAIQDVIASVGLENEVQFWLDHKTSRLRMGIPIVDTPVVTLNAGVTRIEQELTIEDCVSGVLVAHQDDQPVNRVAADFSWHPGCASSGAFPDTWFRTTAGGGSFDYGTNTTDTGASGSNFGIDMLITGDPQQKLGAEFEHDPGGEFEFSHHWFADSASEAINLSRIAVRVGNYRAIEGWSRSTANDDFTYHVKLQGCTDYDTGTNTGTWEDLGCELRGKPDPFGVPELIEFDTFLLPAVNAVRLVWLYMPGPKRGGDYYRACVHDLIIEGNAKRYTLVQTSATVQNDPAYLYAVAAHKKMRGGVNAVGGAGAARCELFESGPGSDTAALSIGRARLITKLGLSDVRNYQYEGIIAAASMPVLGDTVTVTESPGNDFTGILRAYTMSKAGTEGRQWTFRLHNPDGGVIG